MGGSLEVSSFSVELNGRKHNSNGRFHASSRRNQYSSRRLQPSRRNHLDLFSGIGGFALAAQWAAWNTVGFSEIDKFAVRVLKKNFPDVPNYGDINNITHETINQPIDILTGGFPCQPFSVAGKQKGKEDDRHLWPEMLRVIRETQPTWIVGENVAGIINMELGNCVSDLEGEGYRVQCFVIPACAVDARHRRDRVWIVANSTSRGRNTQSLSVSKCTERENNIDADQSSKGSGSRIVANSKSQGTGSHNGRGILSKRAEQERDSRGESEGKTGNGSGDKDGGNSVCKGLQGQREKSIGVEQKLGDTGNFCRWTPEPCVGRVAHGVSNRVDRLRGLGNAIVPQVAFQIMKIIDQYEAQTGST